MSRETEEPSELEALFERSAQSLDPIARGRLRARAREIPERKAGISALRSLWAWASALAVLGAACALFFSLENPRSLARRLDSPPPATMSAPPMASLAAPAPEADDLSDEADELTSGTELDDPMSPDVLDDLALDPGDLAESEVDAWISAAGSALGG